ncbi:MAG TPA: C4-dicarboxylate ABC transporter substrate-binding protein [Sedimenticola thiotaurini]|uniref:C4-dicarboxylate ABC transporter substrate-binding protein n=1 Tax=Sedimenticola thiotaurini TaxID=1543721 RepID=A0A831RK07_9GAMM|nr:C4-dicarboxylate ABC transporter substrate-binding protein [Sedimenticola thiotaurini]
MKRLSVAALMLAAATLVAAPSAFAEKTLRITLQLPIKHHLGQNLLEFKKEVEKETGGSLKIEIYPSAQLYKDKEVPQAVSSGAIEMGVASITRFAGTIPAVDIFYVPFMFPTADKVRKATEPGSPIRGPLDEAILNTGARPLWWQAFGGAIILSKNEPIKRPEDMKGKKVRVFGKTLGEFVKAVGGAPVLMSGSKQFLAYQRGTVDAGMTGLTTIPSRKLYQVMDYVTLTNHADIEFLVLINEKVWQGLSEKERAVMQKAARRVEVDLRNKMGELEAEALEFARGKMKVVELSPEDLAAWKKATRSVVDTYIQNAGPLGRQLVEAANNL